LRTPDILAYVYLGVNTGTPSLSTKKTRQALAYLVDKKKIIEIIHRGFASPAFSYVLPTNTTYFNPQLPAREYNPAQAIKLLTEDGWADVNNDGLLERNFKGTEQQMVLTFLYPANNEERKSIGLLLRESFAKVGIQLTLEPLDFATFNKRLRSHQFDLMVEGRTINPIADDPEPTFSTNSIQNGGNYPGFGDAETDRLIQAMRTAGEKDRIKLSKRLQWMVHEDASFIFLYHPKERILVNKKFGRVLTSPISPRIWAAGLQIGTKP
jgi:peptide/nickel transport system substrate-binding protein